MKNLEKPEKFIPPATPYDLFREWYDLAQKKEINDPGAVCLATATPDGKPSARMMLLKGIDNNGLVLYTNATSRKGKEILQNPYAALCFHWKSLLKQVRIEGHIEEISDEEADTYYSTRHRGSRVGAWASKQSQPLGTYQELKDTVEKCETEFKDQENIPRPEYWKGFRLKPNYFEFWIDGEFRLHQRYLYTPDENGNWNIGMLYP